MVDQFAAKHRRFDELAEQIKFWVDKGLRLDDAYTVAATLAVPSRREVLERAIKRMEKAP